LQLAVCSESVPNSLRVTVFIDGAARGNPGPAAIGVVFLRDDGQRLGEISRALGRRTNNQAEYEALLAALQKLTELRPAEAVIRTDSQLLFCQMTGSYRVKNAALVELHRRACALVAGLPGLRFEHIPRELNRAADKLANRALDQQGRSQNAEVKMQKSK
jgi:ribonuclease HI